MSTPCSFTNIKTGKTVKAKSVAEFCRRAGLGEVNDQIHIYPALRGERLTHRGWCETRMAKRQISITDAYGNVHEGTILHLLRDKGISHHTIKTLISGRKKVCNGLRLSSTEIANLVPLNPFKMDSITVKTPNNKLIKGSSLSAVQRRLNGSVTYRTLFDLLHGIRENRKGYEVEEIVFKRKSSL